MSKKKIVILIIIIVILALGIFLFIKNQKKCVEEGLGYGVGFLQFYQGKTPKCCSGLKNIPSVDQTDAVVCSDCGNGACEKWENKYNCSEDCR